MMEVFNPTGATGVTAPFAPRLETLNGRKIALLSSGIWQAHRTMPLLQTLFAQKYPTTKSEIIQAGLALQDDKIIDAIFAEGYDAVIVGNAA